MRVIVFFSYNNEEAKSMSGRVTEAASGGSGELNSDKYRDSLTLMTRA